MPEILNNKEEQNWEEEWEVITNTKGKYILSKMQAIVLKQAIATGNRGTIMFETFAIAIPYIVEFYRVRRFLKDTKQLPAQASEPEYKPIDLKIFEEWKKKVYEKLGKKYKI
jgi:hypothetical protein